METLRQETADWSRRLWEAGLTPGSSGNVSALDRDRGLMAITPSGLELGALRPEDITVMDLSGKVLEGPKPSSEWGLHAAFYQAKPEAGAVVHTHAPYCTVFAVLHRPLEAVHFLIASAGCQEVPCAPYRTFGSPELARESVRACGSGNAVLLANHGIVTCGACLDHAVRLALDLEYLAQLQYRASAIGEPVLLGSHQLQMALEAFSTYGQDKDAP